MLAKECVNRAFETGWPTASPSSGASSTRCLHRRPEGSMGAFLNKRKPVFKHR